MCISDVLWCLSFRLASFSEIVKRGFLSFKVSVLRAKARDPPNASDIENHPPNATDPGLPGVFDASNCITCTSILLKDINYVIYMLLSIIYLQYESASWDLFFTAMKNACRIIMS